MVGLPTDAQPPASSLLSNTWSTQRTATMENLKSLACESIDKEAKALNVISQEIWKFKELAFQEKQSHAALTKFLEERGFQVLRSHVLETAFLATWEYQAEKTPPGPTPHVAFICEYDALPDIGHACGHNLIAEVGLGAALGVKAALEKAGQPLGKISVVGTPAEEGGAGKVDLIKAGLFHDVDVAMMVHPAPFTDARPVFYAGRRVTFSFQGKESHAAGFPWEGVNALDALVQAYVSVSTLRQQLKPSCRVTVIINKGGTRPNIIPSEAEAMVMIRAINDQDFYDLDTKVKRCFRAAADATGSTLTITDSPKTYECLITNETLARLYESNAERIGFHLPSPYPKQVLGSTDMGNVSHVVPSLHPTYNCNTKAFNHTMEFTQASGSADAQESTLAQCKILAGISIDIFLEPSILVDARQDFKQDIKSI